MLKFGKENKSQQVHTLQAIWAISFIYKGYCIWDDLANPKNRFNLVPDPPQYQNVGRQFTVNQY